MKKKHRPENGPSVFRTFFVFGAIVGIGLVAILFGLGQKPFEKIATALAMPVGLLWLFLFGTFIWMLRSGQGRAATLVLFAWTTVTLGGNGYVSGWLARKVEAPMLQLNPLDEEPLDAIVLLGGGGSVGANNRSQGGSSADRLIVAAQAYHTGLTTRLICTGKHDESMYGAGRSPAIVSMDVLKGLGVPDDAVESLGGANTSEEMTALSAKFENQDVRLGIVTSAWHLPRALRLAKRYDLDLIPLPADFFSGPQTEQTTGEVIECCIPKADAMFRISALMRELMAKAVGR